MKSIKFIILSIFCFFLSSSVLLSQNAEQILETNKPALVSIWKFEEATFNYVSGTYSFDTLTFWGSGFIVSNEGRIGTCYHVVKNVDSIMIKTSNGLFFPAGVISVDTLNDLAVLKIQCEEFMSFPFVRLGNSDDLKTGESIYAVGNPLGYEYSISQGIVSGIRDSAKEYIDDKEMIFERVIQTDAAISPGNSGGAFFNSYGEVVGITSYYYQSLGNLNFGVAINCFKKLTDQYNSEPFSLPVISKADNEEKIEYYLEIANSLKEKIRGYDLINDSLRKNLQAKPSALQSDTLKKPINQDSLENIYMFKAEYFYNKCFEIDSTYFNIYDDLIDFYIKIRKPDKAEEIYNNAQKIFQNDDRLGYLSESLEAYYLRYKNLDKIRNLYGIVEGNLGLGPELFYKLGSIYDDLGDSTNALKQYQLAIKKDPKYYKASFQIGKYYYELGIYSKAKKYLESAYESKLLPGLNQSYRRLRINEDGYSDFELYYYLGMISIREGNKFAALVNYLKLNPSDDQESIKAFKLYKKIVN